MACFKGCLDFSQWSSESNCLSGKTHKLKQKDLITLPNMLERLLESNPNIKEKVAFKFEKTKITFGQLHFLSTAISLILQDQIGVVGTKNPDGELVVAIYLPMSDKFILLIFAVMKMGAAYIPINPKFPQSLAFKILSEVKPILIITEENSQLIKKFNTEAFSNIAKIVTLEKVMLDLAPVIEVGEESWKRTMGKPEIMVTPIPTPPVQRPAVIFHARGALDPVLIRISHVSILNSLHYNWNHLTSKTSAPRALIASIFRVDSLAQIFAPLLNGTEVRLYRLDDMKDAEKFINSLGDEKIEMVHFASDYLWKFLDAVEAFDKREVKALLKNLKDVVCIGGIVPREHVEWFFEYFGDKKTFYNFYGWPELTGDVFMEKFNSTRSFFNSNLYGRTLLANTIYNSKVYILGPYLEREDVGVLGEICITGIPTSLGYVNAASKSKADHPLFVKNPTFVVNPYALTDQTSNFQILVRTGDFGRFVKHNGRLRLLIEGRPGEIKIKGIPIVVSDLRAIIKEFDVAEEIQIYPYNQGKIDETVVVFILPNKDRMKSLKNYDVLIMLQDKLPPLWIPEVVVLEEFPKLPNGHVIPQDLIAIYEEDRIDLTYQEETGENQEALPEKTEARRILLDAMYKYVGIPISSAQKFMHLSYYELGGTSLNCINIVLYLNKKRFLITMSDFLNAGSMMAILNKMNKMNKHIDVSLLFDYVTQYTVEPLDNKDRKDAIELMSEAYCTKGTVQKFHITTKETYKEMFSQNFKFLLDHNLSFVVRKDGKCAAAIFNYDIFQQPFIPKSRWIYQIQQEIEKNSKISNSSYAKETLVIAWLGTTAEMAPSENVTAVATLLSETIKLAKIHGFKKIFTMTSNLLLRHLCLNEHGFELFDEYQLNQFSAGMPENSFQPFHLAPDSLTISACILNVKRSRLTSLFK